MDFPSSVEHTVIPRAKLKKSNFSQPSLTQASASQEPITSNAPGVVLDHGRLGAATLRSETLGGNRHWKWEWAHQGSREWVIGGPARQLAPATRAVLQTRAEAEPTPDQLSQSMETYIASLVDTADNGTILDVAREELQSMASKVVVDIFQGNTLERIDDSRHEGMWTAAFPTGELSNELAFLPFDRSAVAETHDSSWTFATSILQLCHSPAHPPVHGKNHSTILYVRLHSSIRVVRLVPSSLKSKKQPFEITELAVAQTDRFKGRRPMDVAVDPETWGRALVVDELGGVWCWQLTISQYGLEEDLRCLRESSTIADERHRVAIGSQMDTIAAASSSKLEVIECLRPSMPPLTVFSGTTDVSLISMESKTSARNSLWTCICTSDALVWVDKRKSHKPALRWKHNRGPDLTLSVLACDTTGDACRYILWSRQSLLVTVYTVSKTAPARSLCDPYLLATPSFYPGLQLQSLSLGLGEGDEVVDLLLLANTGALFAIPLATGLPPALVMDKPTVEVSSLEEDQSVIGEKDGKRYQAYSFIHAWSDLHAETSAELGDPPADLGALVDAAGSVLTGTDWLASRVTTNTHIRSAFLRNSQIQLPNAADSKNLQAAFDASSGKRIDLQSAAKYMLCFDPSDPELALQLENDYFGDLDEEEDGEHDLMLKQSWAAQLLARDLHLSSIVLNTRPIRDTAPQPDLPSTPENLHARVAAALSLQENVPPVAFNYFKPKDHKALVNSTARALLSGWSLGEDPSKYVWNAPDKLATPIPSSPALDRPTRAMPHSSPFARAHSPMRQSQPTIGLARGDNLGGFRNTLWLRESAASLGDLIGRSTERSPEKSQSSDVDLMAQTQVLPGPFGGRAAPKKKPKKRVAGF